MITTIVLISVILIDSLFLSTILWALKSILLIVIVLLTARKVVSVSQLTFTNIFLTILMVILLIAGLDTQSAQIANWIFSLLIITLIKLMIEKK